jgi:hypothetical protein
MAGGVANAAAATPTWITLNLTHPSYLWTYLGGLTTLTLALYTVWIISCAVARPTEQLARETLLQQLRGVIGRTAPESIATRRPAGQRA